MICPYCKKECSPNAEFCPNCGQSILSSNGDGGSKVDGYWQEVNKSTAEDQTRYQTAVAKEAKETRVKRNRIILSIIVLAVISLVAVVLISSHSQNNAQKLKFAQNSMIGETYSDHDGGFALFNGDKNNRIIVEILDNNKLKYSRGNYTFRLKETASGGHSISWTENAIYEAETYTYEMSISFFGKMTITINGKTYDVSVSDDGTVSGIVFYE